MCIDFTELNKACPKDPYPLPRIDVIIDQAASCDMLNLLDCFSGYHHVWMRREDEAKTGFTTPFGIFCFVRMLEGLRNAGSTFNRMMKLILGSQLGHNTSAYVDDIVIMSEREIDHIADLTETFDNMRQTASSLTQRSVSLASGKGNCWDAWSLSGAFRQTPKRLKPYEGCSPRAAERRSKDSLAE
jgi:hypothetical protein